MAADHQLGLFEDPPAQTHAAPGVSIPQEARIEPPASLDWAGDPLESFRSWKSGKRVAGRAFAEHSLEQYGSMFAGFLRWLADNELTIITASVADVERFLLERSAQNLRDRGKPMADSTRRRYLQLLESVFEQLTRVSLRKGNPAAELLNEKSRLEFIRPAPKFLSSKQAAEYISWTMRQEPRNEADWSALRNQALRLFFLASGINVAELQRLRLKDIVLEGEIYTVRIVAHGFVDAHSAPVCSFATESVRQWLQMLQERFPAVDHVFPARSLNFGMDRPEQKAIPADECFRVIQAAMDGIGYTESRQGPQTLRNTFIAQRVRGGHDPAAIMQWCGLKTPESVDRIKRMIPVVSATVQPL